MTRSVFRPSVNHCCNNTQLMIVLIPSLKQAKMSIVSAERGDCCSLTIDPAELKSRLYFLSDLILIEM